MIFGKILDNLGSGHWILCIIAVVFSCPCFAADVSGNFSGNWIVHYDCPAEESGCDAQSGDYFALYGIIQVRGQICGYHIASSDMQRHIDEGDLAGVGPSVYGQVNGDVAIVTFRSALTGMVGRAKIALARGGLVWDVLVQPKGESWFPDHAILRRAPSDEKYPTANCSERLSDH